MQIPVLLSYKIANIISIKILLKELALLVRLFFFLGILFLLLQNYKKNTRLKN